MAAKGGRFGCGKHLPLVLQLAPLPRCCSRSVRRDRSLGILFLATPAHRHVAARNGRL
jgi:hypothetical protein